MIRFPRQPEPDFWGRFERRWLHETAGTGDPLRWKHQKRTLAEHFHALVRPPGEARNCAYCDGRLRETSPETIDHFIPKKGPGLAWMLALTWSNLYPACSYCNTTAKRTRGSCFLVRPDVEPVERWLTYDPDSGRIDPAPELERLQRARVRRTLHVLRLNMSTRREERKRLFRELRRAWNAGDNEYVEAAMRDGPYRIVVRAFLGAKKPFGPLV